MQTDWAKKEFELADLGDQRLNKRIVELAQQFSKAPESPINQACTNWANTKAAYRFFGNDSIDYVDISSSHQQATLSRAKPFTTILAVQDTTYFNYSAHPKTTGLCPLSKHEGKHKKEIITSGLVMHSTLALSPEGLPLGLIDQKIYARETLSEEKKALKKKSHGNALPTEEKDSIRWLEALTNTHTCFASDSTRVVTVCDRESDIYDFFVTTHIS